MITTIKEFKLNEFKLNESINNKVVARDRKHLKQLIKKTFKFKNLLHSP